MKDSIQVITSEEREDVIASVVTDVYEDSEEWDAALQWYNYVNGITEEVYKMSKAVIRNKGGEGSGHFGHSGRPGKHGGSLPGKGSVTESVNNISKTPYEGINKVLGKITLKNTLEQATKRLGLNDKDLVTISEILDTMAEKTMGEFVPDWYAYMWGGTKEDNVLDTFLKGSYEDKQVIRLSVPGIYGRKTKNFIDVLEGNYDK